MIHRGGRSGSGFRRRLQICPRSVPRLPGRWRKPDRACHSRVPGADARRYRTPIPRLRRFPPGVNDQRGEVCVKRGAGFPA